MTKSFDILTENFSQERKAQIDKETQLLHMVYQSMEKAVALTAS